MMKKNSSNEFKKQLSVTSKKTLATDFIKKKKLFNQI